MIEGFEPQVLIAAKGYDSGALIEAVTAKAIEAVIPPKKNRTEMREYDRHLYRETHWLWVIAAAAAAVVAEVALLTILRQAVADETVAAAVNAFNCLSRNWKHLLSESAYAGS